MEPAPVETAISPQVLSSLLAKSRLLDDERLRCLLQAIRPANDSACILHSLTEAVEKGWLTRWHVEELLAGRAQFFVDKYKLLEPVGKGGMGVVYRAEHSGMGRIVALKLMSRKLIHDEQVVQRFLREIHAVAALNHPNIVRAYDADTADGRYYLVMEYVPGKDLAQLIRQQGSLAPSFACEIIVQAACGLQHAHEHGLVHRDIKPANLLVEMNGNVPHVKLLDLGLARFVQGVEDGNATRSGVILGTIDYMSPEQVEDTRSVDIRGDVFSLGCTLFHALTGRKPFEGAKAMERLMIRTKQDAPRLRTFWPEAPAGLDAVLAKMLARSPSERYATPADVADALAPFADRVLQPYSLNTEETLPGAAFAEATLTVDQTAATSPLEFSIEDQETILAATTDNLPRERLSLSTTAAEPDRGLQPRKASRTSWNKGLVGGCLAAAGILMAAVFAWQSPREQPPVAAVEGTTAKPGSGPAKPVPLPNVAPEGFLSLFDGKSLEHWEPGTGAANLWGIDKGMIFCKGGDGWLITRRTFRDFILRLEWHGVGPTNSGLSLRIPTEDLQEKPPGPLQLDIATDSSGQFWSRFPHKAKPTAFRQSHPAYAYRMPVTNTTAYRSFNQWNGFEIECRGDRIRVSLNGIEVNDVEFAGLPREGHIALQSLNGRTEFRNIYFRELGKAEQPGE